MKKGYIDKWTDIGKCHNLLFFAQLVNELIFDYSIPSNRVATLNSHYLCLDALSTIGDIDENGVPEGSLKPILEELYDSLSKDSTFSDCAIKPIDLFVKQDGNTYRRVFNVNELKHDDAKRIVIAIYQKFFQGEDYCNLLKLKIKKLVDDNREEDQGILFSITKSFMTEVINAGYAQQYIYEQLIYSFFNKKSNVSSPSRLARFLDVFTFKDNDYSLFFIADKSYVTIAKTYKKMYQVKNQMACKTSLEIEKNYLKKSDNENYYLVEKITAFDPFSAAERLIDSFHLQSSFYRLNDHNVQFEIADKKIGIYDSNGYFTIYKRPKDATKKAQTLSVGLIEERIERIRKAASSAIKSDFSEGHSLINAVSFHSLSLDSKSNENKLLDLWAIFETLLNISNKHTADRIHQMVSVLIPVLRQKYLHELFSQLKNDIQNYSGDSYNRIVSEVNEADEVLGIAKFVLLDKFSSIRSEEVSKMVDFPLLRERINYYNKKLSNCEAVYSFVNKHSTRICWQIMRIYRNRNLIIHNGRSMPYLPLLIENLHSYVDTFLDYMIDGFSNGNGKEQIYQELFLKECNWLAKIKVKKKQIDEETVEYLLS